METYRTFGAYLHSLRAASGLTQSGLAKKIGSVQPQISRLENGEREPSVVELIALRDEIGMDPDLALDLVRQTPVAA